MLGLLLVATLLSISLKQVPARADAPIAEDDSFTVDEDSIDNYLDVLANDDPQDGTLRVVAIILSETPHGTVDIIEDGLRVSYTPDPNFYGEDVFWYRVDDGKGGTDTAQVDVTVTGINDPPDAQDDDAVTNEDTPVVIDVLANDSDIDGDLDPSTVTRISGPSNGSTSVNTNTGAITYTPNLNWHGEDAFTYQVCDTGTPLPPQCSTATVTITVIEVNDPPVADAGPDQSAPTNTTVTLDGSGSTDLDNDYPLTYLWSQTGGPAVTLSSTTAEKPTFTAPGDPCVLTFTLNVTDARGLGNLAPDETVVTVINRAPVADDDDYSTPEDTPLTVAAPGVLANDTDADGDPLTAVLMTGPASGTLVFDPDGSFVYTPTLDFNGTITFTYQANDGTANSNTATVTITVTPVNDPPVAHDQTVSTNENTPVDITLTASDVDGDPLTYSIIAGPAHGTLSGTPPTVTYTPDADYYGSDSFTFKANDGISDSNVATVSITVNPVNDPPVAVDDEYSTPEDTPLTVDAPGVLANDTDADDDPLTALLVTGPVSGTLAFNADGSFVYTPTLDYNGLVTFTYQANDGTANSNTATVTLTVTPVNDPPVAVDDFGSTDEDNELVVLAPGVLANDTDVDGDPLTVTDYDATSEQGATVTVGEDGSYSYDPTAAANLQALAQGETIVDTFTYTVGDGHGGSDTATVRITVQGLNDQPTARNDGGNRYTTDEDTPFTTGNVLDNDTDPDTNDTLSVSSIDTTGTTGEVIHNGDGTFDYDPDGQFEYLSVGQTAEDTFTYTVSDGHGGSDTATVTITVIGRNDNPTAQDDANSINEDTVLDVAAPGVLGNDTDPDTGDTLRVTSYSGTSALGAAVTVGANGRYTYDPTAAAKLQALAQGETIVDTFTYTVGDGHGGRDTATVHITVEGLNDRPTARNDGGARYTTDEDTPFVTGNVLDNDTDPDRNDSLSVIGFDATGMLGQLTHNGDGTFRYDPNGQFEHLGDGEQADETFTYTIADRYGGTDWATVTIVVNGVNDAPVAVDCSFVVQEDSTDNVLYPLADAWDAEGDHLTIAQVTSPVSGTIRFVQGRTALAYTPAPDFYGFETLTYTISDGNGGLATAEITIEVENVNDDPLARPDTIEIDEDSGYNPIYVLDNDTYLPDPPETLTIVGFNRPQHGKVTIVSEGAYLQYRPNDNFYGIDTFAYTIADGNGGYATASVQVTVRGINDPPNAEDDSASTPENTPVTIDVLANDSDIDGQLVPSTVTVIDGPSHGSTHVDTSNGKITYTPDRGWYGNDSFDYRVCDNGTPLPSLCSTATVSISVGWVNSPPIANAGPDQRVDTLSLVTLDGSGSYDPDNNYPLTYLWSQTGGPAVMLSSATAEKPTFAAPGDPCVLTFTLRVIDSEGWADNTPDEIVVTVRNQPPIANAGPDQTVQAGSRVTLDGAGSADPDHDLPLTYLWAQSGGPTVTLSGATTARPSFTAPDERTVLTFTLLVADAFGEPSPALDQVVIRVHKPYYVFMPVIAHRHVTAPDLVIQSITAHSNGVELVIANQGNAPVGNDFWVDVYINPRVAPTAVNQPWYDLGNQGLVWGVFGPGLSALKPGGTLTLKTGDPYYFADYSKVSWPLPAGTPIYGQVDSYNDPDTGYGTVHELDEILGRPYNNIIGPILSTAGVAAETLSFDKAPGPAALGNLPPRP